MTRFLLTVLAICSFCLSLSDASAIVPACAPVFSVLTDDEEDSRDLPDDKTLAGMLRKDRLNFVFIYSGQKESRLKKVIFFHSDTGSDTQILVAGPMTDGGDERPAPDGPGGRLPEGALDFNPDAALKELFDWIDNVDPRMRTSALEAISLYDDDGARRALIEGIHDPELSVRLAAVGLLEGAAQKYPEAESALITALTDSAPTVRHLALLMLLEADSPKTPDALMVALSDEDRGVRELALSFLEAGAN